MSIRFAAPAQPHRRHLRRFGNSLARLRPANDNHAPTPANDVLGAALRHFARHGMAAAEEARRAALAAVQAGDAALYSHWHAVCRTLDKRVAAQLKRQAERAS